MPHTVFKNTSSPTGVELKTTLASSFQLRRMLEKAPQATNSKQGKQLKPQGSCSKKTAKQRFPFGCFHTTGFQQGNSSNVFSLRTHPSRVTTPVVALSVACPPACTTSAAASISPTPAQSAAQLPSERKKTIVKQTSASVQKVGFNFYTCTMTSSCRWSCCCCCCYRSS